MKGMESNVQTYTREAFIALLNDPKNIDKFMALFNTAALIVGDFDDCGEVLQSNEDGMYDETTNIEKLRGAINLISPGMCQEGDYLPHLTKAQQRRLEEVAIEVQSAGNGTGDDSDWGARLNAKSDVETMTPRERLESLKDDHAWRCKRLGFDPNTGEAIA